MSYTVRLRTKNPSANDLRSMLRTLKASKRVLVRLGSRTPIQEIFPRNGEVLEINSIEGICNSRDKRLMKEAFDRLEVKTANWSPEINYQWSVFPAIIKHRGSHGGGGIFFIENVEQLQEWISSHPNVSGYIIEEYKNYSKEYRLHVDQNGCFYTCRKMLKSDAQDRWHRHDSNSVWILEDNPLFEKPKNWDNIVTQCVNALTAIGLTIGACDVKVQTEKGKRSEFVPDFIVMEINSAPSMGEITTVKYFEKIKEIVEQL